jgi:hypothetical protein
MSNARKPNIRGLKSRRRFSASGNAGRTCYVFGAMAFRTERDCFVGLLRMRLMREIIF